MKVYGWTDHYSKGGNSRQGRYIVAAPSIAAVLRLTGMTRNSFGHTGCETRNAEEVEVANEKPGTILVQPLNAPLGTPWETVGPIGARP